MGVCGEILYGGGEVRVHVCPCLGVRVRVCVLNCLCVAVRTRVCTHRGGVRTGMRAQKQRHYRLIRLVEETFFFFDSGCIDSEFNEHSGNPGVPVSYGTN